MFAQERSWATPSKRYTGLILILIINYRLYASYSQCLYTSQLCKNYPLWLDQTHPSHIATCYLRSTTINLPHCGWFTIAVELKYLYDVLIFFDPFRQIQVVVFRNQSTTEFHILNKEKGVQIKKIFRLTHIEYSLYLQTTNNFFYKGGQQPFFLILQLS